MITVYWTQAAAGRISMDFDTYDEAWDFMDALADHTDAACCLYSDGYGD